MNSRICNNDKHDKFTIIFAKNRFATNRHYNVLFNSPPTASFSFIFGLLQKTIPLLQQINGKNIHPL